LRKIAKDRTFDDLIHDDYFAHAVRSAIEVIGEASKNAPDPIKQHHQDIPWRDRGGTPEQDHPRVFPDRLFHSLECHHK
jgi:uncharacterized protein with HEPN domain